MLQRVTQCMSANTRVRGSAQNSAHVNCFTAFTSGIGKMVKSHVAGSNGGTSPACSTGHLCVCTCRGGMRLSRRVSGLMIGSSMRTPAIGRQLCRSAQIKSDETTVRSS